MNRSHTQMVTDLKKPGSEILADLTPELASAAHMLTGIYDEHLELIAELMHTEPTIETLNNIKLEAGDLVFYLDGLLQDLTDSGICWETADSAGEAYLRYAEDYTTSQILQDLNAFILSLTTPVKRLIYYNKPFDAMNLHHYANAVLGIVSKIASMAGFTMEQVKEANKEKLLGSRYKEGKFSDEQANARKDEEIA